MDALSSHSSLKSLIDPNHPAVSLAVYNLENQTVKITDFMMRKTLTSIPIRGATNQNKFGKKVTSTDPRFGLAFHDYYIPTEKPNLKWISYSPIEVQPSQNKEMFFQLISPEGVLVAQIEDDQIRFHHDFLEEEMKTTGILIPGYLSSEYEDKKTIRLGDKLFLKAFREIYCPSVRKNDVWKESGEQPNL